jgi:transcriptional regulator with XRE-family HTH domain
MEHRDQMILRKVGRNLKAERARRDLTQETVARASGMYTTQVARMERGETDTGITKYLKAAWAIGMDPSELFTGLEDRMP